MPFPTTAVLDAFTRADTATTWGTNWTWLTDFGTVGQANFGVLTNQGYNGWATGAQNYNLLYWNVSTFPSASEAYVTVPVLVENVLGEGHFLYLRIQDINVGLETWDGYNVGVTWSATPALETWVVNRSDDAVDTQLGSSVTETFAAGDSFAVDAAGTRIRAWHKSGGVWTVVTSQTDATYGVGGYIGIYGPGETTPNTWRYDDFGGGQSVIPIFRGS